MEIVRLSQQLPISDLPNYMQTKREERTIREKNKRLGRTDINSWEKRFSSWRKSKTLKNPNRTLVDGDIFLNIKSESGKDGMPIEGTNRFTK